MSAQKMAHKEKQHDELIKDEALVQEALEFWCSHDASSFYFVCDYKTYWCDIDEAKFYSNKNQQKSSISLPIFTKNTQIKAIANCVATILYSQIESGTEECIYYVEVRQSKTKFAKSAFTAKQLANSSDFKQKVMATLSGSIFTGNTHQLNTIFLDQAPKVQTIETIPYIGYFSEVEAYIYADHAVYKGRIYQKNEDDFFALPH